MATVLENGKTAENANGDSKVPNWVNKSLFEEVLRDSVVDFKQITEFKAYPAMAAGENYATIMLRVEIVMELKNNSTKSLSLMMKVPQESQMFEDWMKQHNIFHVEAGMYRDIVPDFEQMYRNVGLEVKFGAQIYNVKGEKDSIVLEDLRPRGFKNADRLAGLDMEHTKCVLKKLAQWHAASAKRVETKGQYDVLYYDGYFKEEGKELMHQMAMGMSKVFFECLKQYEGHEAYAESSKKMHANLTYELYKTNQIEENEFNVLNHGDCWTNNVMFQYDEFGKIKETYFVDYQIPKYGTPAQDLLYFILSSTSYDLKLKQFDYLIKFYHDNLIEYLNLLEYPKKLLPTLKSIHMALYKYGVWGYSAVTGVMAAVLLDPTESASLDNFINDSDAGNDFKMLMYSSPRYRKHAEALLPWLHNRGAMEC